MNRLRTFPIGLPLFAANSAWNQRADQAQVLDDSDQFAATTARILKEESVASMWVNFETYTFPIFRLKDTGKPGNVEVLSYAGDRFKPTLVPWYETRDGRVFARGIPLPAQAVRPSDPAGVKSDGSLILYSPDTRTAYDIWQATTVHGGGGSEGSIVAVGGVSWFRVDQEGPGCQLPVADARLPGTLPRGSSRASGLPYLGGLLLPEDVLQGEVRHALAFTLPQLRHIPEAGPADPPDYIYPATRTETSAFTTDPFALAAGMRIRLRKTVVDETGAAIDESDANPSLAPISKMFFKALREYGAYLVDGSLNFGFAAEDYHTAPLNISPAALAELVLAKTADIKAKLASGKTKWQILMEKLDEQLSWELGVEKAPISYTAADGTSNFDVVEGATIPDVNWQRHVTAADRTFGGR
jgi:hypothetical protein